MSDVSKDLKESVMQIIDSYKTIINIIVSDSVKFNDLYNSEYLPKYKSVMALKNKLKEKIELGYVDDKY